MKIDLSHPNAAEHIATELHEEARIWFRINGSCDINPWLELSREHRSALTHAVEHVLLDSLEERVNEAVDLETREDNLEDERQEIEGLRDEVSKAREQLKTIGSLAKDTSGSLIINRQKIEAISEMLTRFVEEVDEGEDDRTYREDSTSIGSKAAPTPLQALPAHVPYMAVFRYANDKPHIYSRPVTGWVVDIGKVYGLVVTEKGAEIAENIEGLLGYRHIEQSLTAFLNVVGVDPDTVHGL